MSMGHLHLITGGDHHYAIIERDVGRGIIATVPLNRGEVVFALVGRETAERSRYTIQLSDTVHLHPDSRDWGLVNHSCAPNCAIDVSARTLITLRPIAAGEELTFDYLTTETVLADPFECQCGATNCVGLIAGDTLAEVETQERVSA